MPGVKSVRYLNWYSIWIYSLNDVIFIIIKPIIAQPNINLSYILLLKKKKKNLSFLRYYKNNKKKVIKKEKKTHTKLSVDDGMILNFYTSKKFRINAWNIFFPYIEVFFFFHLPPFSFSRLLCRRGSKSMSVLYQDQIENISCRFGQNNII